MGPSLQRPNGNTVNDQKSKTTHYNGSLSKETNCFRIKGKSFSQTLLRRRAEPQRLADPCHENKNRAHCDWFRGTEVDIGQCGNTSMNICLNRTPSVCTWGPFYSKCSGQHGGRKRLQTEEEQQLHLCGEGDAEHPSGSASVDCEADGPEELNIIKDALWPPPSLSMVQSVNLALQFFFFLVKA